MMAQYRRKPGALVPADRDRALDVSRVLASNPSMKKAFWFLEADLKRGTSVKMDNTGKALLQLLRHLKRFSEVRSFSHRRMQHMLNYQLPSQTSVGSGRHDECR